MSTLYGKIVAETALRVGALNAAQSFVQEGLYTTLPLTLAEIDSKSRFSLTAIQDAVLQAEEAFALTIASTANHPWRRFLGALTSNLADKALLPTLDAGAKQIIGSWGAIRDSSDSTPLLLKDLATIDRRVRNSNSHYTIPVYWYAFDNAIIRHTRTNVVIEVCSYDRATQSTALLANGAMLLPDPVGPGLVDQAVAVLDKSAGGDLAAGMMAGIKGGLTTSTPRA